MKKKIGQALFLLILLAIAAGWGYSRINPKFADRCDSFYKAYLKPGCDAGLKFCRQTGDKIASKMHNPFEKNLSRRNAAPMD